MEKQRYNEQMITHYLLGSLPKAETERFDELRFIDAEFAERLQAVEDDLVDAYVSGELSEQLLERFNSYYLASPKRRNNLRFAQALQVFSDQAAVAKPANEAGELTASRSESYKPTPWLRSVLGFFIVPRPALQWSFAAVAVLMLGAGGWLVFDRLRLRGQLEQGQAERAALQQREKELQAHLDKERSASAKDTEQLREDMKRTREKLAQLERQQTAQQQAGAQPLHRELKIVPFDLALQMRAIGKDVILTIPPGTDYVTMQLDLEADDHPAYRAELRTQTGDQKVWSAGRLKSRARGQSRVIDVSIRADRLTTRGYLLLLKGIAADGSVKDAPSYAFRVVKQ